MRRPFPSEVEAGRIAGVAGECQGVFQIRSVSCGDRLNVIASDGTGWIEGGLLLPIWEHVSVSHPRRCPTWEEMVQIKRLFWTDEECVIEFHPPQRVYVNLHSYCLHLWRIVGVDFPLPPQECL